MRSRHMAATAGKGLKESGRSSIIGTIIRFVKCATY